MLIKAKVRFSWIVDDKIKRKVETFILDKEVFAQAENEVTTILNDKKNVGLVDYFEITSLRLSVVKMSLPSMKESIAL